MFIKAKGVSYKRKPPWAVVVLVGCCVCVCQGCGGETWLSSLSGLTAVAMPTTMTKRVTGGGRVRWADLNATCNKCDAGQGDPSLEWGRQTPLSCGILEEFVLWKATPVFIWPSVCLHVSEFIQWEKARENVFYNWSCLPARLIKILALAPSNDMAHWCGSDWGLKG